jgi:hypothetical protein
MQKFATFLLFLALLGGVCPWGEAQVPAAALAPVVRQQFFSPSGVPLSGGSVETFAAGTSTPLATYTDSTALTPNPNPVLLDDGGFATIWLGPSTYKFVVKDSVGNQQYTTDNVSDVGLLGYTRFVLVNPTSGAMQTITGPLTANYFQGSTLHFTSPNVRVNLLDPATFLDTATNPPEVDTTNPAIAGQKYTIPDPGTATAAFVMTPGVTGNILDCTAAGLTCKRPAYIYFEGGGCNNTTAAMGWDTFGANSPTPLCVSGTNIAKGVLALPSAATHIQKNTNTVAAGATVTVTYTAATTTGNLLVATVIFDGTHTITGCTDGTNAYTQAKHVANTSLSADVWYFNGNSTGMAAASTLTCTFNTGTSNAIIIWHEYSGLLTSSALDVTASNTGTGTAVDTGTTAGTAQNTELVFAFGGALTNPTMVGASGFVDHGSVAQSTNLVADDQGKIQQSTATQNTAFTLGSSQVWAAGVVTFKANVAGTVTAQRQWGLPSFYLSSMPVNAVVKWQAPQLPTGTINAVLGAAVVCTADGSTDDPAFLTATTSTVTIPGSSANTLLTTPLSTLTQTGCAASNLMHFQIQRLRYNASDTYESYIYVNGVSLGFGINQ